MNKKAIGILDAGLEGLVVFNELVKQFPNNQFIYLSDFTNYPYEEKDQKDILQYINKNTNELLMKGIGSIIVLGNSMIEYSEDYYNHLGIPTIKINDLIINYVNEHYEHKNILFLAKSYIVKSAMYNKNFRYNRLYNVYSEQLDDLILNRKVKTALSFSKMGEVLKPGIGRDVDVIVYVDPYYSNLNIELKEYFPHTPTININKLVIDAVSKSSEIYDKKKETSYVYCRLDEKEFKEKSYYLDCKYKYVKMDNLVLKDNEELEKLKRKALKMDNK